MSKVSLKQLKELSAKSEDCNFYIGSDGCFYKFCKCPALFEDYKRAFQEEFIAMTYVHTQYPNISFFPKYKEYNLHHGVPYISMEYINKDTLETYLKKRAAAYGVSAAPSIYLLQPQERNWILTQLYNAIEILYKCGILFFDINPSNILIMNEQFDIKLIDFTFFYSLSKTDVQNKKDRYKRNDPRLSKEIPTSLRMANALLFFYVQSFYPCKDIYTQHSPNKAELYNFFHQTISPDCARLIHTMFFKEEDISRDEWGIYEKAENSLFQMKNYLNKLLDF